MKPEATVTLSPILPSHGHDGPAPADDNHGSAPRAPFSTLLGQYSTPPFAPWPQAPADIKTPVAGAGTQTVQPAERGRRQGQRRGRG